MSVIEEPKKYLVEIVETLSKQVVVEAKDDDEAYMRALDAYTSGQIILDSGDYMNYEIYTIRNVHPKVLEQAGKMLIKEDGTVIQQ